MEKERVSREELMALQKKSPKKVHLLLREKYDICCVADETCQYTCV